MRLTAIGCLLGLLLFIGFLPATVAQTVGGIVEGADIDLVAPVSPNDIQHNVTLSEGCGTPPLPPPFPPLPRSESGNIMVNPDGFHFSESQTGTGCALAFFDLPDVTHSSIRLTFLADRVVQQANGNAPFDVVMPQEVWLMDRPGHVVSEKPYFASNEFSKAVQEVNLAFTQSMKGSQLGFYFEDRGPAAQQSTPNPGLGQAFSANVSQIRVQFIQVPLTEIEEWDAGMVNGTSSLLHIQGVNVTLPPNAGPSTFRLNIFAGPALGALTAPSGKQIQLTDVPRSRIGNIVTVEVPGNITATEGAGTYRFQFQTAFPYPPPPLVPTTIPWLPFVALGLVALTGAITTPAAMRSVRQTDGEARRAARILLITVLVTWAIAIVVGVSMLSMAFSELTRLPFSALAVVGYALAAALIAAFVVELLRTGTVATRQSLQIQQRQTAALAQSNSELQSFAYVASHDLQEPLRKVSSYSQLLEERYGKQLGKEGREFIAYTVDGSKRMQALIRDVLTYSRIGETPKPFGPVDLNKVLHRVLSDLEPRIKQAGATVDLGPLPIVDGDDGQLGQLFQNLVGNAIKYADHQPRVQINGKQIGKGWEIRVKDNGIGIAAEHYDRIFQMFQRLHGRDDYEGTGIGLAICKKIVERHHGSIAVESAVGKGTTFTVRLPGAA